MKTTGSVQVISYAIELGPVIVKRSIIFASALTGVSFSGGEPVVPMLVAEGPGLKLVVSTTSV